LGAAPPEDVRLRIFGALVSGDIMVIRRPTTFLLPIDVRYFDRWVVSAVHADGVRRLSANGHRSDV
jgi:hypothetical protein